MRQLHGVYLVGPDGATITWSDGSQSVLAANSRVRLEQSDPHRRPARIHGRLVRLANGGPTYEAPERRPG